jgi:hypothetical protein
VNAPAAQGTLDLELPAAPRRRRPARTVTPRERHLQVAEPPLTERAATEQARQVIAAAGLTSQVSRVFTERADNKPGHLFTVALLRAGGDLHAVATALAGLPGAQVWCGTAAVGVYRSVT